MSSEVTTAQMASEARREVGMRKRVYQRWVDQGRNGWTQERADRGIAVMVAIAEKLEREVSAEAAARAPTLL